MRPIADGSGSDSSSSRSCSAREAVAEPLSVVVVPTARRPDRLVPNEEVSEVRVGLCGFTVAFEDYVREFPVVEVQGTFYEPPRDLTMMRWRAMAPETFEFTLKAWQLVTHDSSSPTYRRLRRPLTEAERREVGSFRTTPVVLEAWRRTLECVRLLHASAVLLQCPRTFRPTAENAERMHAFFGAVERPEGVRMLWEPRGPWPPDLVRDLCRGLRLVHVVDPFVSATVTPEETYFRLHGTTGARHVYTDAELEHLAALLPRGRMGSAAYVLFNNLPRVGDARRFVERLGSGRASLGAG
jgi:uncharacterized protein YecE (DUF72 family)